MKKLLVVIICVICFIGAHAQTYNINESVFGTYTTTASYYNTSVIQPKALYNTSSGINTYGIELYADKSGTYDVYCPVCNAYLGSITVTKSRITGYYKINTSSNFWSDIWGWISGSDLRESEVDAEIERLKNEIRTKHKSQCKGPGMPIGDGLYIILILLVLYSLYRYRKNNM